MLVFSSIHLSNYYVGVTRDLLSQLNINWLEFLTVTAPRSIGLEEDELVSSEDKRLEVLSNDNFDWIAVRSR
jgi:hypothetical protein